jgi:hypothetical protein
MEFHDVPIGLLPGVDHAFPTIARTGHVIFGRAGDAG